MDIVQFGIIGTAKITHRFLRGVSCLNHVEVKGIASRTKQKAEQYCEDYAYLQPYDEYASLWNDKELDAVYIATPNHTHFELVMQALKSGLHVLCEKPMMLHEEEVKIAFQYAKQHHLVLMEAMKPCFLPTTKQAKRWMEEGRIGELRELKAQYCSNGIDAFLEGHRSMKECGGGALYDLGVYPLAFVNHLHPHPIVEVKKSITELASGIDAKSTLQMVYEDGVSASVTCAIDVSEDNYAEIIGSKGSIRIQNFWKSDKATLLEGDQLMEFYEPHDMSEFQYEIHSFVQSIRNKDLENSEMSEKATAYNAHIVDHVLWEKEL